MLKICGAALKYVTLRPPDWSYDPEELQAAFSSRTKFILVNTPSNPCGKVFTRDELTQIADLCKKHDALCVTDEIYEYILYDGRRHISPATLPGMDERTITISGFSKTFSSTLPFVFTWSTLRNESAPVSQLCRIATSLFTCCSAK